MGGGGVIDRDDIPAGLIEPGEIAGYQEWVDYWNGLSDEDRAIELRAMADYVEYTRGES